MENKIKYLIDKVKKYNGEFVFLWYNSSFGGSWKKFEWIYEKVLKGSIYENSNNNRSKTTIYK